MHIRHWKQTKYPYNPNKPKIIRFGPTVQPHAKGCDCKGCSAYLKLIAQLNPERHKELTKPQEDDFRRNKGLPEHVHVRRRLHMAMLRNLG